jgi:hypothetical protein
MGFSRRTEELRFREAWLGKGLGKQRETMGACKGERSGKKKGIRRLSWGPRTQRQQMQSQMALPVPALPGPTCCPTWLSLNILGFEESGWTSCRQRSSSGPESWKEKAGAQGCCPVGLAAPPAPWGSSAGAQSSPLSSAALGREQFKFCLNKDDHWGEWTPSWELNSL